MRGNLLTETHIIAGQTYTLAYQYDTADRVTQITYPSGRIVTYTRDAQGRVTGVTTKKTAAATTTETLARGVSWKPMSSLLAGLTYGNGLVLSNTYTLDYEINRILLLNGATGVIDRTHARTDLLNLTGITDAVTPANNQTSGTARSIGWPLPPAQAAMAPMAGRMTASQPHRLDADRYDERNPGLHGPANVQPHEPDHRRPHHHPGLHLRRHGQSHFGRPLGYQLCL